MTRKYLNTLIALVLLAGLWGSFTYYEKRKSHELPASTSKPSERLFPMDREHIETFTLQPRDGEAVTCARDGKQWVVTAPEKLPADQSEVMSVAETLGDADEGEVIDPHPKSLKDYGLESPSVVLDVTTNSKPAKFELLMGDNTPAGGDVYAQVAGDPRVFTLPSYMQSTFSKKLFDLRDKRGMTLNVDQLQSIAVKSGAKSWSLQKNPEGVWDLVLPPPVRANSSSVDNIVSELRSLAMTGVVAEDKNGAAKYGLSSPQLEAKLTGPDGTQTILLGKKDAKSGGIFAMNSALSPIFTLNSNFLNELQLDPASLRSKDLFSYFTSDVTHVEVDTPAGHRTFDKQGEKWKQTYPTEKDVAADKLESFLDQLRGLTVDSFPTGSNLAQFGLSKPAYRFQVKFGNKTETLEAAEVGSKVYARLSTDPLPSELVDKALDPIVKSLAGL